MKINPENLKFNEELATRFPGIEREYERLWPNGMTHDDGSTIVFEGPLCQYAYRMLREGNYDQLRKVLAYVTDLAIRPNPHHDAALFFMEAVRSYPGWSLMTEYFPEEGKPIFLSKDNDCGPDRLDERGIYDPETYFEIYEGIKPKR